MTSRSPPLYSYCFSDTLTLFSTLIPRLGEWLIDQGHDVGSVEVLQVYIA